MANEKYFPFRSVSGDRKYSAEDWAEYFAQFLGNGVFYSSADKLKVAEYEGMKVKVQKGAGFINGRMYILETDKVLTLDTADGVLSRIDRIVLRCDYTNRTMSAEVVKGSYSQVPAAPALTRDADVYELALADVYVAAGVVKVTAANITDQRLNTSLCGIVTGLIEQADTTEIFNQFQAYMTEFEQEAQTEFNEWFEYVKGTLSEDAAGNLLLKIEEVESIAKGRNQAHVFATTEDMQEWLSNEANKGLYNVGDNLYIADVEVPDWWISEVLEDVDAETGYYYKIAQLETQKVDLTEYDRAIAEINSNLLYGEDISENAVSVIDLGSEISFLKAVKRGNHYSISFQVTLTATAKWGYVAKINQIYAPSNQKAISVTAKDSTSSYFVSTGFILIDGRIYFKSTDAVTNVFLNIEYDR